MLRAPWWAKAFVVMALGFPVLTGSEQKGASPQKFEEASIKPCDPESIPAVPEGTRGGGMNSFRMTPGRTYVSCMTLGTLIRTAYGYGPANLDFLTGGGIGPRGERLQIGRSYGLGAENGMRVKGGPGWVQSDRYSIEAVAAGEPDGPTMSVGLSLIKDKAPRDVIFIDHVERPIPN